MTHVGGKCYSSCVRLKFLPRELIKLRLTQKSEIRFLLSLVDTQELTFHFESGLSFRDGFGYSGLTSPIGG